MDTTDRPLPPDVLDALNAGNKVEAITRLRAAMGLDLTEAKQLIDAHARGSAPAATGFTASGTLPPEVTQALMAGNKIEAIRLLRARTGMGLKEAKDAVDAAPGFGTLSPGEVRSRGFGLGWVLAAVAAAVAWYFLRK